MSHKIGAAVAVIVAGLATPALADRLPAVQLTPSNQPQECTTPGRLTAFIESRNPGLRRKFQHIAVEYARHGRDLGVRWDYAFFQMVVETNSLKYTGDVSIKQNNFAGLGATGGGVRGEAFRTVSDGVRAHLQHLMIYAGIHVDDPVADRTRKVQSWGILNKWRNRFRRPITYSDVGAKWAPLDRRYGDDIQAIADAFYSSSCRRTDPYPEMMAQAGMSSARQTARANFRTDRRAGLGASAVQPQPRSSAASLPATSYRTLNSSASNNTAAATTRQSSGAPTAQQRMAAAARFAAPGIQPRPRVSAKPKPNKCRVWTASYGGQKATIIRSNADGTVNYTVLDVNSGREDAEAKAYIAAYAKGGQRIGDFASKTSAMNKAFKLCPKG